VCYGRGGIEPTSTDAALTLGFIDPGYFVGGEMTLDVAGAEAAVAEKVGAPLGLGAAEAAMAIVQVQTANMVTGIRAVSVQQGFDPRDFTLLPFGGAGALYAGLVAADLGISRILVPVRPSVLSALGMLLTDVKYTEVATRLMGEEDVSGAALNELYGGLGDSLTSALAAEGMGGADVTLERSCDMRYRGQAYEINVAVPGGALDDAAASALITRFHDRHEALYGQAARGEPVELVNYRVTGLGVMRKPELKPLPVGDGGGGGPPVPKGVRAAYFGTGAGWRDCAVFERAALAPGAKLDGPAIVEEAGATIVLYPVHGLEVDGWGNLLITVAAA
jgi:N-methylhydantoinase A